MSQNSTDLFLLILLQHPAKKPTQQYPPRDPRTYTQRPSDINALIDTSALRVIEQQHQQRQQMVMQAQQMAAAAAAAAQQHQQAIKIIPKCLSKINDLDLFSTEKHER